MSYVLLIPQGRRASWRASCWRGPRVWCTAASTPAAWPRGCAPPCRSSPTACSTTVRGPWRSTDTTPTPNTTTTPSTTTVSVESPRTALYNLLSADVVYVIQRRSGLELNVCSSTEPCGGGGVGGDLLNKHRHVLNQYAACPSGLEDFNWGIKWWCAVVCFSFCCVEEHRKLLWDNT